MMTYSGPFTYVETRDVYVRPRFLRDILWAFFEKKPTNEMFLLEADRQGLVKEGIIEKNAEGRYLLTEKGQEAIDAEHNLWEQWSGVIR